MRRCAVGGVLLVTVIAFIPGRVESQGLGGLIKKKATEAVKGKDGKSEQGKTAEKDDGPITSQFGK